MAVIVYNDYFYYDIYFAINAYVYLHGIILLDELPRVGYSVRQNHYSIRKIVVIWYGFYVLQFYA